MAGGAPAVATESETATSVEEEVTETTGVPSAAQTNLVVKPAGVATGASRAAAVRAAAVDSAEVVVADFVAVADGGDKICGRKIKKMFVS